MIAQRSGGEGRTEPKASVHRGMRSPIFQSALASILLVLAAGRANAQAVADSLWTVWNDRANHDTVRMKAMIDLAWDHYLYTRPDSAHVLAGLIHARAESMDDPRFMAVAENLRGASWQVRGNFPAAIERYEKALAHLRRMGDERRKSDAHNNIGGILYDLKELDRALTHYDSCMVLAERTGNEFALADALLNSATIVRERGDTGEALSRYQRSLEITTRIGHDRSTALNHGNIGRILSYRRAHAAAQAHLVQAISIAGTLGDKRMLSMFNRELGEDHARQGRYVEAIAAGQRSMAIARPAGFAVEVHGTARMLYRIYKQLGDLPNALAMHELYAAMADTLHNQEGREELVRANMRLQFREQAVTDSLTYAADLERVANEREKAQRAIREQRRLFLGGMALVLVLGGTIAWGILERRRRKAWYEREQAIVRERARIASDMHDDMGSGLSALRMRSELAQRNESDPEKRRQFADLTQQATELIINMRQIIWAMHSEEGDLEDTLDHCTDYARAYLREHGLEFSAERAPDMPSPMLSPQQRRNIFLVVKEALHNTVKHAHATCVTMQARWDNGLILSLHDDGKGSEEASNGHAGRGLVNMTQRMADIGGQFNMAHEKGTLITVRVPMPDAGIGPTQQSMSAP